MMCSYNAVQGKPTCLSPLMRNLRKQAGFQGYVTSDSDSVKNAYPLRAILASGEKSP
jgi:beta-glucosidase-like glycosyl hydrolase